MGRGPDHIHSSGAANPTVLRDVVAEHVRSGAGIWHELLGDQREEFLRVLQSDQNEAVHIDVRAHRLGRVRSMQLDVSTSWGGTAPDAQGWVHWTRYTELELYADPKVLAVQLRRYQDVSVRAVQAAFDLAADEAVRRMDVPRRSLWRRDEPIVAGTPAAAVQMAITRAGAVAGFALRILPPAGRGEWALVNDEGDMVGLITPARLVWGRHAGTQVLRVQLVENPGDGRPAPDWDDDRRAAVTQAVRMWARGRTRAEPHRAAMPPRRVDGDWLTM